VGYRQFGSEPGRHRGLPSPYLTLIVTLDDPLEVVEPSNPHEAPGVYETLLGGLHKTPTIISHPGRQSGVQLSLEPLGARALLGLPAAEIANLDVPAADVLGPLTAELYTRIRLAATWAERFDLLDEFLLRRLVPGRAVAPEVAAAWSTLRRSGGCVAIDRLAYSVGWSSRHFGARFLTEIGLSPKAAARVIRFDRARRELQRQVSSGALVPLAALAADTGYYDQAHLALEFREIAGCSPSQWVAEEFRNFQAFASDDGTD
jgi:AraC-like DNA-binding protein